MKDSPIIPMVLIIFSLMFIFYAVANTRTETMTPNRIIELTANPNLPSGWLNKLNDLYQDWQRQKDYVINDLGMKDAYYKGNPISTHNLIHYSSMEFKRGAYKTMLENTASLTNISTHDWENLIKTLNQNELSGL